MAALLDIEVPRNGQYKQGWKFRDRLTGVDLDISDWTFALDVKASPGADGSPIASAVFSNMVGVEGTIDVFLDGADFASVEGEQEVVRLSYDCLAKDGGDVTVVQLRGQIILMPGVSTL